MFDIQENLKKLPDRPGVYMHKDSLGEVIYVGKAVSLKNRVRQYFQSSRNRELKVRSMVKNISEFEYIVTDTEMEALILECNLIKKYKPKYNILLRDDKTYPYIKVTMKEEWPRVLKTRTVKHDGSKYFGPYTDVSAVNNIVDFLNGFLKLKGCSQKQFSTSSRPCLNYHIGRCAGLCSIDKESEEDIREEYLKSVSVAIDFLSGRSRKIAEQLTQEMRTAAEELRFEDAAYLRNQIHAMEALGEKQSVVKQEAGDIDVVICLKRGDRGHIVLFFVRDGKLVGRESFRLDTVVGINDNEAVREFITQYYYSPERIPGEILIEEHIDDEELIGRRLTDIKQKKVMLQVPKRGHKKALLELAIKDSLVLSKSIDDREASKKERIDSINKQLEEIIGHQINRIEAYDISNINGVDSVGAMVVFENTAAIKNDFRKFKIRTVEGADDFASMQEVIYRRFKRFLDGDKAFSKLPDIIFMDGGKPQITAAEQVLAAMKLDIPVAGMVKDDNHRTRGLIWKEKEYKLSEYPILFKYVTAIQDKVHEFAIDYHTGIRNKSLEKSILDDIKGIGKARKKSLIREFGSIEAIKAASEAELAGIPGMNVKAARAIKEFFVERET